MTAGQRAYVTGFEDGNFYAQGWHITGEMGGVWTQPLKLVDGVWFGIGDQWLPPATTFTSGWGYTRLDFPATDGLSWHASPPHRYALNGGAYVWLVSWNRPRSQKTKKFRNLGSSNS